ncbi:hypothetical protein SDC9_212641 [bioreactor metagenome]|uniref:Uncharacterized protein n=1 Tax=bioreactor metagenome TaxID=1076179 RepID=A0A645K157_9ZZZZ
MHTGIPVRQSAFVVESRVHRIASLRIEPDGDSTFADVSFGYAFRAVHRASGVFLPQIRKKHVRALFLHVRRDCGGGGLHKAHQYTLDIPGALRGILCHRDTFQAQDDIRGSRSSAFCRDCFAVGRQEQTQ